jgi:metal-responsive CopG/Arc/MetJ family transcriptional regulator
MAPSTRLSVSIDKELVVELQATLQLKEKRSISISEVIRVAVIELAKANKIAL